MQIIEFRNIAIPMFQPEMEQSMTEGQDNDKQQDISLFDVKELYDRAYALKECAHETSAHEFKDALSLAVKLDMEYRRQLLAKESFTQYRAKDFSPAIETHKSHQKDRLRSA